MFTSLTERCRRKVTAWRDKRRIALLSAIADGQVYETTDYESFLENADGSLTVLTRATNRLFAADPPLAAPGGWVPDSGGQRRPWELTHVGERELAAARATGGAR